MKLKMPNGWRKIKSLVNKIRLHGRRGKGMAESLILLATAERRWMENPVLPSSCVTSAGTPIEVQTEWEENTHTHKDPFFSPTYETNVLGMFYHSNATAKRRNIYKKNEPLRGSLLPESNCPLSRECVQSTAEEERRGRGGQG